MSNKVKDQTEIVIDDEALAEDEPLVVKFDIGQATGHEMLKVREASARMDNIAVARFMAKYAVECNRGPADDMNTYLDMPYWVDFSPAVRALTYSEPERIKSAVAEFDTRKITARHMNGMALKTIFDADYWGEFYAECVKSFTDKDGNNLLDGDPGDAATYLNANAQMLHTLIILLREELTGKN